MGPSVIRVSPKSPSVTSYSSSKGFGKVSHVSIVSPTPSFEELAALASVCFPALRDVPVVITEFSRDSCRVARHTLREVLESNRLLEPPIGEGHIRWVFAEYYKLGTFWGSDQRCFQWGTDPAIFENSPIRLLQERLAELDRAAGRSPPERDELPGEWNPISIYMQSPCESF